jgi:ketosteroid isomerase-like protein
MKYCANCNLEYPDTSGFCKACGGKLAAPATAPAADPCPACDASVLDGWRFCKQCGHTLDETTVVRARTAGAARAGAHDPARRAPLDAAGPSVAAADPGPPEEQCKGCGYWNGARAGTCAACGDPVGSYARRRRAKRALVVSSAVLFACVILAAAGAAAWYVAGVSVSVQTDPGGSKIVVDGEEVGQTNESGALLTRRLFAGDHTLTVTHDRYDTWRQDFNIALTDFGKSLNVKLNLTKYKLTVTSSPPGGEVLIDNVPAGKTSGDAGTLVTAPLAPGAHTLLVRAEGYRDWKQDVDLKGDASLAVKLSAAPVAEEDTSSSEGEVRTALDGWAQSIQNRDINAHMRYYADTLDYYYARTVVPSARVRDDREKAFQKFTWLSVQLSNLNLQMDSTGQRATAFFDKTFDFRGSDGNFFSGSVQNQLTLTKLGGAWLITGEKELKVYDVKSSPGR